MIEQASPPVTYTTYGSVRGCCGHEHASIESARRCLDLDRDGCDSQGGYSDREIVLIGSDGYLYRDMGQVDAEDGDHWIASSATGGGVSFGDYV